MRNIEDSKVGVSCNLDFLHDFLRGNLSEKDKLEFGFFLANNRKEFVWWYGLKHEWEKSTVKY